MLLLLMRGREEDEKEDEKDDKEEEEEEELSFLLSRKLRRVSMSKSILLSDGFTVAVLRSVETSIRNQLNPKLNLHFSLMLKCNVQIQRCKDTETERQKT